MTDLTTMRAETDRRTRRIELAADNNPTGAPVWAEIVEDLTWGELKRLPAYATATTAEAVEPIAKYVIAWNIEGRNDAGERVAVPPPARDGAIVFDCVERWVISWLFNELHGVPVGRNGGDDLRKKPMPSDGTPSGASEAA